MASVLKPGFRSSVIPSTSLICVVDGDDLIVRGDPRAGIAELLEPDITAAVADHQPLIILEILLWVLRQDIGLELRSDDRRIMTHEPILGADDVLGLAVIAHRKVQMRDEPCLLYTSDAADEEDSVDLGG